MSNEILQIENRDIKQEIIPVQKAPLLPDAKSDILIVLLNGSSKEEKKRLQKAYKYANIVEENQLKYLNRRKSRKPTLNWTQYYKVWSLTRNIG